MTDFKIGEVVSVVRIDGSTFTARISALSVTGWWFVDRRGPYPPTSLQRPTNAEMTAYHEKCLEEIASEREDRRTTIQKEIDKLIAQRDALK
jgi:hypothetical protein